MSTKNTIGCVILLGGAAMGAAVPALPSKALRGGAGAQVNMQTDERRNLAGSGPMNNDETNRKKRWRSWLSVKDATDGSGSTTFAYAGCFESQVVSPFDYIVSDDAMTPEICEEVCRDRNATFYGLLGGDTCSCGDDTSLLDFDDGQTEGVCGEPCAGDASESCGGLTAYDIFMDEDVEISSDDIAEEDPVYVGCYEIEANDPFYELITDDAMTVELCHTYCGDGDALYFGLMEGNMCGCGNTDGFLSSAQEAGTCDISCGGDASETCGGTLAYDLFQIEGIAINPSSDEDTTCSDGTIGVQSGDSCCVAACGECGGVGCSTRVTGLDAFNCCATEIADVGVLCSESGVAPCVVEDTEEFEADDGTDDGDDDLPTYGNYVGYEYVGCYNSADTFGFEHRVTQLEMTHEFCYMKCALDAALYMAITEGNVCKCGADEDFLDTDKEEGACDIECPGDASTICGSDDSFSLFELIVASSDTESDADDDGSDVPDVEDDDSPAVDDDTGDDTSIETNGSGDGGNDADSDDHEAVGPWGDYVDYDRVGCFMATNTFGFRHRVTELSMTHEFCFRKCALNYAKYMAITEGIVCKCGVDEDFVDGDKEAGSCDVECPGDSSQTCGSYDGSYELFSLVMS